MKALKCVSLAAQQLSRSISSQNQQEFIAQAKRHIEYNN